MTDVLLARLPYFVAVVLVGVGLFVVVEDENVVKKVLGLGVFQTGIFLVVVAAGVREGGRSPLVTDAGGPYVNPLPHVLVLTAIVVGVSVTAVALALSVRLYREYGTLREDALREAVAGERGGPDDRRGRR